MAIFPSAVATDSDLYIAVNATSTQLTDNPLTSGATTVNVVSAAAFPSVGFISVDNEIIKYTGKTGASFTGCTRGADGTSASSHVQNSQVFHNVIAAHHNASKDEIIAVETFLNTKLGTSGSAYSLAKALQTNSSTGIIEVSAVTNTELGYLSGVTSALQTQINAKATDSLAAHLAGSETFSGQKTFSAAILHADGTVSLPGLSFSADSDTGLYRIGANDLGFSTDGVQRLHIDTAAITAALALAMGTNKITGLGNATAAQDAVAYTQNKILQVVMATSTTLFNTTSSTFTATNLSGSITPSSTSSKILVFACSCMQSGTDGGSATIRRGGTNVLASGGELRISNSLQVPASLLYLDSPASVSSQTYDIAIANNTGGQAIQWGEGSRTQVLILVEVNGL